MKKKFFIALFVIAVIGLFTCAYFVLRHNPNPKQYKPQQNIQAPIEIPSDNISTIPQNTINTEKPAVLMFYVDWCTYCRRFMPIFGEYANRYNDNYNFIAVNCDKLENAEIVKQFHIINFPSLFIYDKKINHKFALPLVVTVQTDVFEEELNSYINVRKNFMLK